ncbi:MAG: radical SAM family heme chaperone HemW [Vicingaceae bacterium]
MAGIYIHIPFCKQACSYCDFHFSTNISRKNELLAALQLEMHQRSNYLNGEKIETIYFGGGTPSLLTQSELLEIFDGLHKHFEISKAAEITIEVNPDDLDKKKLKALKASPINRLSIGVQSFFDEDLRFMNRAHSAKEAVYSLKKAQDIGFENMNIDLIFGSQTTSNKMWEENLKTFFDLQIPHLSAYSLTVEEKTALWAKIKKGKVAPIDDDKNHEQYQLLQQAIDKHGFQQYEVSNYCSKENYSKHNTSYWFGINYLGLGPSAHSFNEKSRQWNVRNNIKYTQALNDGKPYFEQEVLTEVDQYNEYLITSLRTKWGIQKTDVSNRFSSAIQAHFEQQLSNLKLEGVENSDDSLIVKRPYLFQSDEVVRELMI